MGDSGLDRVVTQEESGAILFALLLRAEVLHPQELPGVRVMHRMMNQWLPLTADLINQIQLRVESYHGGAVYSIPFASSSSNRAVHGPRRNRADDRTG